jgi:hypothetical protein
MTIRSTRVPNLRRKLIGVTIAAGLAAPALALTMVPAHAVQPGPIERNPIAVPVSPSVSRSLAHASSTVGAAASRVVRPVG